MLYSVFLVSWVLRSGLIVWLVVCLLVLDFVL